MSVLSILVLIVFRAHQIPSNKKSGLKARFFLDVSWELYACCPTGNPIGDDDAGWSVKRQKELIAVRQ